MVRPRRAYRQHPAWTAIHITTAFVAAFTGGVLLSILIWG